MKKATSVYWYSGLMDRLRNAVARRTPLISAVSEEDEEEEEKEGRKTSWDRIRENNGRLTDMGLLELLEDEHKPAVECQYNWMWIKKSVANGGVWKFSNCPMIPDKPFAVNKIGAWMRIAVDMWAVKSADESPVFMPNPPRVLGLYANTVTRVFERAKDEAKWGSQTFDAVTVEGDAIPSQKELFGIDALGVSFDGKELVMPNMRAFYHKVAMTQGSDSKEFDRKDDVSWVDDCHGYLRTDMGYSFIHQPLMIQELYKYYTDGHWLQDQTQALGVPDLQHAATINKYLNDEYRHHISVYSLEPVLTNFVTGHVAHLRKLETFEEEAQPQPKKRKASWSEKREKLLRG